MPACDKTWLFIHLWIYKLHALNSFPHTGEKLVGPCNTLFMDEISTGLDSSTTYLIVKCIRNFVHMNQVSRWSSRLIHCIESDFVSKVVAFLIRSHILGISKAVWQSLHLPLKEMYKRSTEACWNFFWNRTGIYFVYPPVPSPLFLHKQPIMAHVVNVLKFQATRSMQSF